MIHARHLFLPVLGLATLLAACGAEPEVAEAERVTVETVERYRTDVMLQMQLIDGEIAALETTAAAAAAVADSAAAAAYTAALSGLLTDRRALQARLDSLGTQTPDAFTEAAALFDRDLHDLRRRVGRTQLERALTPNQLREAAQARLDGLANEIARVRAAADSSDAVAALDAQQQIVATQIAQLGTTSEEGFAAARAGLIEALDTLLDRLNALRQEARAGERDILG